MAVALFIIATVFAAVFAPWVGHLDSRCLHGGCGVFGGTRLMCACAFDFTCPRCLDTPADPRYLEDEYEPQEDVVPHDLERLPRA